jgi:Uma2 family endonuclease
MSPGQQLVLCGQSWQTYLRLLWIFRERHDLRITFDRGALELMTLSHEHENISYLLARFVDALTEELDLPIKGGKSTTFKRRKKQRGLEADNSFWIANEALVRGKTTIDLRTDPPPDLALEIEVSRSALNRLKMYEALGVPEVWRFDGQTLTFHVLGPDGKFAVGTHSRAFPGLRADDVARFFALRGQLDENAIIRQFRAWVRQRIAAGWQ